MVFVFSAGAALRRAWGRFFFAVSLASLLTGCTALLTRPLLEPLALSFERQTDLGLVRDGTPSLILMLDGFIASAPEDRKLLMAGTRAYSLYASVLQEDGEEERAQEMGRRAKVYGLRLLSSLPSLRKALATQGADFGGALSALRRADVELLFWGAYGWASWIAVQGYSPAALADAPKVEQLMLRVVELDELFYFGAAHVFLGAYYGARPAMLGGSPEKSRGHFERALAIADRQFLPAQVLYAETYARMSLDRELFESLLSEVLAFPLDARPELSLANRLAKEKAGQLLDRTEEYFQ